MSVVGCLGVDIEVKILAEVDVARGDVMKHGCVALAESQPTGVRVVGFAGQESVVSIVLDFDRELNGFT
jgi:hypothetical protein